MKRFLALFVTLLLACGFACAEELAPAVTLTAEGAAPLTLDAQTASIAFVLTAEAETADGTNAAMEAKRAALLALLQEQGAAAEDVHLTRYDMAHVYDYHHTKLSEKKLLKGFRLEAGLETQLKDEAQARRIVDALFSQALNVDYKLTFAPVSSAEAEDAALELAAQEAVRKAQLLAQTMGISLDGMISVEETVEDGTALVEITFAVK